MLTVSGETKRSQRSGKSDRLHIFCGRGTHQDVDMLYTVKPWYTHARYGTSTTEGKGAKRELHDLVVIMSINPAVVDECPSSEKTTLFHRVNICIKLELELKVNYLYTSI